MTNYYDILKNVCVLAHEEKPTSFAASDSFYGEIKQYIKDVIEEVCSKYYWTFRERTVSLQTVAGLREYDLPHGVVPSGMLENGVRIEGNSSPLYFMFHNELDAIASTSGKPYRYSVYSDKIILDPTPDNVYSLTLKYLTVNFAFNADKTLEKENLQLETDICIIPDRFVKVVEWGAYSLYRQNFKPDEKFKLAYNKYLSYLLDMQKQDGYCGDSSPVVVINRGLSVNQQVIKDFFKP